MRRVAVAAGLIVALAAPPASSQPTPAPHSVGWRAAAGAALAFGAAEGKRLAMTRFSIPAAPTTKKDADVLLDGLDRVAKDARDAYLFVERYGSPFWTAAAEIRIGDTFVCQAKKIAAIPIPPQITAALPPDLLDQYVEVLHGLTRPLEDQAARVWERTATSEHAPTYWTARARERLAGITLPDC